MDVITEKPRPVVPHCGACCGASGPGQGAHAQYRPARSEAVTWPTGPGSSTRRRWQGPARLRDDVPNRRASHATARDQTGPGSSTRRRWRGPARLRDDVPNRRASHATARDQTGPGCGGRGCRRGLAGLRDRPLRAVRLACGDHAGRPPPTDATHGRIKQPGPTAGSNNTWNTSYTRNTSGPLPPPTDTAHRCHPRAHQAARPHKHTPPDTRHQTRARNTIPTHNHRHNRKRAGTPRFRPALDTQRLSAPRARWRHATGAHRCTTAVSCQ